MFDDSNASNDQLLTLGMFVVVFFFQPKREIVA